MTAEEWVRQLEAEDTALREQLAEVLEHTPDLLLLDYHLPGINGIELYDRLHTTKGLEEVPAIMVSARLPRQELASRKIVGMNKPLDLDELLEMIEKLIA